MPKPQSPEPPGFGGRDAPRPATHKVSDQLEGWLGTDGEQTLGTVIELFVEESFAIVFVLLLGMPALPLPTGGATHVFDLIAMLLAVELRWATRDLAPYRSVPS